MVKEKTRFLTYSGIGIALVAAITLMVQVPIPQTKGYINLGDAMIMVMALLFGWKVGFLAGGLGSALADLIGGYAHWAPFTLLIKGVEGLLVGLIAFRDKKPSTRLVACVIGGLEMVAGYFFVEVFLYGKGAALAEVPGNFFQAGVAAIVAPLFTLLLVRLGDAIAHRA